MIVVIPNDIFLDEISLKPASFNADFNSSEERKFSTDSGKYLYAFEFEKNEAIIGFGKDFSTKKNHFNLSKNGNLNEAANNLYKTLRKIKNSGFKSIAVNKFPNIGIGKAINDRLKRASNK